MSSTSRAVSQPAGLRALAAVGSLCLALFGAVVVSSVREKERGVVPRALEAATAPAQPSTGLVGR